MNNQNSPQEIDLSGQVAIVTGGGRGIGRAMALALAKAGATVAAVARSTDELAETVALVEEAGGHAMAITTDVADAEAVSRMAQETRHSLGPIDLLVNNAGVGGTVGPLWEVDADAWWRCQEINLRGPFLCAKAVLPPMVSRGRGRIVTVVSSAALGPVPMMSAYAVSKAAATRLTENLAAEAGPHGIAAFAIHPGLVRTAMAESALEAPYIGDSFRQWFSEGLDIPPEDSADLVVLLASGKADDLSGCYLTTEDDLGQLRNRLTQDGQDGLYRLRLLT